MSLIRIILNSAKSLVLFILVCSCKTRVAPETCQAPKEYQSKSVGTIMAESRRIVARPSEKKALTFCIYGSKKPFMEGIIENFEMAKTMYPGWDVIVFADSNSVPKDYLDDLRKRGVIVYADPSYNHASARFFVADLDYDRFISRDSDSRIYPREVAAVADWMKNDWAYIHGMRDAPDATDPLLAGMWGGVTKKLREKLQEHEGQSNMAALYVKYMGGRKAVYGDDQKFLADVVVKSVGYDRFMSHESAFCDAFPNSRGFPIPRGIGGEKIGSGFRDY